MFIILLVYFFRCFRTLNLYLSCHEPWFVIIDPYGQFGFHLCNVLWTRLRVSFNAYFDPLCVIQVIYRALTRQLTTRWYFIIT
jgi:hypothetical protein